MDTIPTPNGKNNGVNGNVKGKKQQQRWFGNLLRFNATKKEASKQQKKGMIFRKLPKQQKKRLQNSTWIDIIQLGLWVRL